MLFGIFVVPLLQFYGWSSNALCGTYIHFLVADDDWYLCHFSRPCFSPTLSLLHRKTSVNRENVVTNFPLRIQYFHSSLFCPLQNKRNKGSFRSSIRSLNNSDDDLSVSLALKLISPRFCFWAIVVLVPISHSRKSGQELWAVALNFADMRRSVDRDPCRFPATRWQGHWAVPLSYCDKSVSPQNTPPVYVAAMRRD